MTPARTATRLPHDQQPRTSTIAHSYDTYDYAVRAVNALEAAGVPHDDISLVSGDKNRQVATTVAGDNADGTATGTGASIGTLLGGGAGLLAGLGALAIPGVGPVVAAGWLIATLTGAGVGAAAGGLLGSLTGAGVDEADAKTCADHIGRGGTLVTVRASDEMAPQVEYILEHGQSQAMTGMAATATAATARPWPRRRRRRWPTTRIEVVKALVRPDGSTSSECRSGYLRHMTMLGPDRGKALTTARTRADGFMNDQPIRSANL